MFRRGLERLKGKYSMRDMTFSRHALPARICRRVIRTKAMSFLIMAVLSFGLSACTNNQVGPRVVFSSQFPSSVSSAWTYAIYDSIAHQADAVTVSVHDKISASSTGATYIWIYRYSTHTDSIYVVTTGDTIGYYYILGDNQSPFIKLIFPLKVGQTWAAPYNSFTVEAEDTLSVPAGSFSNAFRVFDQPHEGNFYGGTTYWIVPQIGIVKERLQWFVTVDNERENQTWQLLSYAIAK